MDKDRISEEEDRNDSACDRGSVSHLCEYVGKGLENQSRSGSRRDSSGKDGGHDGETCKNGEDQIGQGGTCSRQDEIFLAGDIG